MKLPLILLLLVQASLAWAKTNAPPKLVVDESPVPRDIRGGMSFAPVVKKVAPSVVNIYSTMVIHERQNPVMNDPFFRRFFGEQFGDQSSQPRTRKEEGLGSGVIVSSDGYVLTANHVVEGAESVKVALASGEKEFDAKIIGTDPPSDIAVLKIESKKPMPPITIGDSDKLEVGDIVLAVGNPFAVGQTVTMGIVSALGRGGYGMSGYENFIQTDAAINPGNSGGALVDAEGRLIGINTAIFSRSGGNLGVGFAVPINLARFAMDRLITTGKVARGYLGINIQPLTTELAHEFNLPDESSGVLVGGVTPNGAAEKAGLKDGDVIVELNGKKVTDPRSLQLLVAQTPPHSKASLRILRSAEAGAKPSEKTLTANLGELPAGAMAGGSQTAPREQRGQSSMDSLDGVEVTDLDASTRRHLDIPSSIRGAVVSSVEQDSNAGAAGLRAGDVILEIDRQPVHSSEDAVQLSEKAKGEHILLRIWSKGENGPGGTRYLVVDNTKHK